MRKPIITIMLVVVESIWFLVTMLLGTDIMFSLFGMYSGGGLFRILTSPMIHSGVIHFASNMLCLWFFGKELEKNIGHLRFYFLHLICVITSGIVIDMFGGMSLHGGASGYIFGLIGATYIYNRKHNIDNRGLVKFVILNILITFTTPSISWQGHIGGLIGGLVFGLILCKEKKINKAEWKVVC